ncbi:MAG: glycosyltransferase, partial [Gemmatimonadetes bacterium]|nr:glycosyltransferase [Gemmatimonadota bacterium]
VTLYLGILTTLLALGVAVSFVIPQTLPTLQDASKKVGAPKPHARFSDPRLTARQNAAHERLLAALAQHPAPLGERPELLKVVKNRATEKVAPVRAVNANVDRPSIVAGFFVNWNDNSLESFRAHAKDLDWVIGEWAFLTAGGDSLKLLPKNEVLEITQELPEADRPRIFGMVSNFDPGLARFDSTGVRRLLSTEASRQRAAIQLVDFAQKYGLAGITVDFEEVPDDMQDALFAFMRILRAGLAPGGRILTSTVAVSTDEQMARRYAAANDYVFLMLYDEHYGQGDPGPVASQQWYEAKTNQFLQWIPPKKTILALGAYGYNWDDAGGKVNSSELTFQDVLQRAREHGATVKFDSVSLNPYLQWSDPDGVDHVAWFLDGTTAFNQARFGVQHGAAGTAIWRLGDEDPAIWKIISNDVPSASASALEVMEPGYDVPFLGKGDLLRIITRPSGGRRIIATDKKTGYVVHESIIEAPSPWIVQRFGSADSMKIALSFDDGPDPRYTPAILDTLKSRGVKATFFVVGKNANEYPNLLRRVVREGHELGNHTYTHPNLALASPFVARMEIVMNGRLIESITGRRTALFRPPYFGDADPTTANELVPIGLATDLGYLTVGVTLDSQDWHLTNPTSIIDTTLYRLGSGNVVLLHDSGGDRHATVAALGPLIDSLRANGDSLVLVSELAGISRDAAMPRSDPGTNLSRTVDIVGFGIVGIFDWLLTWTFIVAMALALGRLAFIIGLAAIQRRVKPVPPNGTFAPDVAVIVPAFREEKVIVRTVESLLAQDYVGPLEIIVVDDGSPDETYDVARQTFDGEPRVRVFRKSNGGKSSALNYGIARTEAEIVVCLDADTQFEPQTVTALVAPLADPAVGAVAVNAKVGNRVNLVTRWQALEYVTSQNLDRRAFSLLDCITVIPGAVGAWRRSVVLEVGGFTNDTLAEDQDLTIRIRRAGHKIGYSETAIAWTEAPDTISALGKQRFRWSFGTLQCAWKHKDALLRPRYGTLGWIALPNTWLFQLLLTALSPLADLVFVWSLLNVWLTWRVHGEHYALTDLRQLMMYYGIFVITDWLAALIAFLFEPDEEKGLSWLIMLQRFVYRQLMYSVVWRSVIAAGRGGVVGWGKLERKATVARA